MLQKLLNNFAVFILLLISSCSFSEKERKNTFLLQEIEKILNITINNATVLIVSEYDCESCAKNTFSKINSLIETNIDNKIFGIYFNIRKKNNIQYKEFVITTKEKIEWKSTNKNELFGKISQHSDKQHSPFLIQVKSGRIEFIKSISKN